MAFSKSVTLFSMFQCLFSQSKELCNMRDNKKDSTVEDIKKAPDKKFICIEGKACTCGFSPLDHYLSVDLHNNGSATVSIDIGYESFSIKLTVSDVSDIANFFAKNAQANQVNDGR